MSEYIKNIMFAGIAEIFIMIALTIWLYKVYITHNIDQIRFIWIYLIIIFQTLIMIYGLINNEYVIYLPALICLSEMVYILYVKLTNVVENKIEMELIKKDIL